MGQAVCAYRLSGAGVNRQQRRAAAAKQGTTLGELRRRFAANEKAKKGALTISPAEARKLLAKWAAQPGRTQAEIDRLNADIEKAKRGEL